MVEITKKIGYNDINIKKAEKEQRDEDDTKNQKQQKERET